MNSSGSSMLADTWRSITQCCGGGDYGSRASELGARQTDAREGRRRRRYDELTGAGDDKSFIVLQEQPALVPPPSAEPLWPQENPYYWRHETQEHWDSISTRKRSTSRGTASTRRGWFSGSSTSRRPQISAPSNFRHVLSESFQFPPPAAPAAPAGRYHHHHHRPPSFHPLELSIHRPENRVSSILSHFVAAEGRITPPPPAHTNTAWDNNSVTLTHERSYSSMSFHLPRRQNTNTSSFFTNSSDMSPPAIPPRARARAYTSPAGHGTVERIASAMIERDRLQDEIDSVVERQSIYISSRPSTAYGTQDFDPVPSIPALPAHAPSFAERLSTESHSRPQTAPSPPIAIPVRSMAFSLASATFATPPQTSYSYSRVVLAPGQHFVDPRPLDRPLAPPLPLVLRPPLRKKKSFSRVSSWLFPPEHESHGSLGSITNLPRPVADGEGFYAPIDGMTRTSVDTVSDSSSWETEGEVQTVPTTTWSPGSSPAIQQGTPRQTPKQTPDTTPKVDRRATFGRGNDAHRPVSVGLAF